jgi:beta-lactam-binding protein with PASTA domain
MRRRVGSSPVAKILIAIVLIVFIAGITLTSILALLPQKVSVPDFVGMKAAEAAALAGKAGLKIKTTTTSSADYGHDQVISQNPAAGQRVAIGTAVEVMVNR